MNTSHRTGFRAGVDFTEDSRLIDWQPAEACTDIGADDENEDGAMEALAGALIGFVLFVAVVGFAMVCTGVLA
jgi:hypothetical protein